MTTKCVCVFSGGRLIYVSGNNLDVVQEPRMVVTVSPLESVSQNRRRKRRRRRSSITGHEEDVHQSPRRHPRMLPDPICAENPQCKQVRLCVSFYLCVTKMFLIDHFCPTSLWSAAKSTPLPRSCVAHPWWTLPSGGQRSL